MQEVEQKIGYKDVLKQKEYLKIIIANLISRFGDAIDAIAFTWLVYAITESAAWSAIVFAVNQLPSVLVQPFAGPLVEGMDKKKVMVVTDVIRGLITAGLAVLYLTGNVTPWILLLFTACNSTVEAFCLPAATAVIPKILDKEYYTYGTSLSSTLSTVVQMVGIAAAGVIIGAFGVGTAIFIDGLSFFGSAFILCFLKIKETNLRTEKLQVAEYFKTLKDGAVYLKSQPVILNFCIMGVFANAIIVPINSLQTPLISEVMGGGSELLSIFSLALLIGMGAGSMLFPFVCKKLSAHKVVVISGCVIGLTFFAYTTGTILRGNVAAIYALTILASFTLGASASILSAVLSVQFMKVVSQDYLARVGAIFNASACAATPIVSAAVGAVSTKFSVSQIFMVSGILCVILFVITAVKKVRFE